MVNDIIKFVFFILLVLGLILYPIRENKIDSEALFNLVNLSLTLFGFCLIGSVFEASRSVKEDKSSVKEDKPSEKEIKLFSFSKYFLVAFVAYVSSLAFWYMSNSGNQKGFFLTSVLTLFIATVDLLLGIFKLYEFIDSHIKDLNKNN